MFRNINVNFTFLQTTIDKIDLKIKSNIYLIYKMPIYTCEFCKKVFLPKKRFYKTSKQESSCISIDKMQELTKSIRN